jgi:hypothetical protein
MLHALLLLLLLQGYFSCYRLCHFAAQDFSPTYAVGAAE